MALANRSTAFNSDATTAGQSINLPVGSGNNRVVVAIFTQFRNPVTVTAGTLNGVAGTLIGSIDSANSQRRAIAYIWLDADLPANSGNYTVAYTGAGTDVAIHAIHYSGAEQDSTPAFATGAADSGATSISLSPAFTAGATIIGVVGGTALTITGGQTAILASTSSGNANHASGYDEANGAVSYSTVSAGYAAIAVTIEEAAASGLTITSVNTTNTTFSAQTDSAVVGTGLSASVVCTYAGIACINESASSSTSLKITFPNFFTNNIKLGRNYEFKVVG